MEQFNKLKVQKVIYLVITKGNYIFIKIIGKGGFGKVWKVQRKKDNNVFAMK